MSPYSPPLNETLFVLRHVAQIWRRIDDEPLIDGDPDLVASILEEAGRLATEVFAPLNRAVIGDVDGARLSEKGVKTTPGFAGAYQNYAESGWLGLAHDEAYDKHCHLRCTWP